MELEKLREQFEKDLSAVRDPKELEELRNQYLGRKRGAITALLKDIPNLPQEQRGEAGKRVNEFKELVEQKLQAAESTLKTQEPGKSDRKHVDWTLPGIEFSTGAVHPLTLARRRIEDIFREMGYAVMEGPEMETDFFNFAALNFPPDHPARDMQDTLFVDRKEAGENLLLRTHTSPVQIRTMLQYKPPVRILCPGRVYRKDEIDASHSPIFHQIEGLAVDEHITFADLKGTLLYFLQKLFAADVKLQFRPSFFPFTEPSAEVDVSCVLCKGKGCNVCKGSGWIEILGSGMVHPNELEAVGYDSEKYTGFAFGLGIDRVALLMHSIPDIRLLYQNDVRFLFPVPGDPVKVSYNWLKEFVDVPDAPKELAERLTFAGIKLEGLEETGHDTIFDFEILVNRPDWLSINGVAREVAALYGLDLKTAYVSGAGVVRVDASEGSGTYQGKTLRIALEAPELCPRFCGQIITGVTIGPSPDWVQQKLAKCGLRPINNVVDITNLVMMELGQPLHAYDYDKLAAGTIRVRRAGDEKLLMIDGKERRLRDPMVVIADANRVVGVGGVMGGKETEVTDSTKTLLLEAAYFQPNSIRKTAKALEMSTDASYRFERGADHNLQAQACRRASFLFEELAGGKASEVLQVTAKRFATIEVPLRPARIRRVLGIEIEDDFAHRTLLALGFAHKSDITWEVPSFRVDVAREIDLIEEIARHYGYNRFPDSLPASDRKYQNDYATYTLERQISDFLRSAQVDEASTYSFVDPASPYLGRENRVKILNPISEAASELRTSIIPGLLEAIAYNLRHRNEQVKLFEIGRVFLEHGEKVALGIAILGGYRELKGIVESVFPALNYPPVEFRYNKIVVSGRELGSFGSRTIDSMEVQTCELYLNDLQEIPRVRLTYKDIIPYPFVQRDVTFLLPESVVYGDLEKVFAKLAVAELQSCKLSDTYKGPNTPQGKIAFTFRLVFQRPDRTLTSEEVDLLYDRIVSEFASNFGAELRK